MNEDNPLRARDGDVGVDHLQEEVLEDVKDDQDEAAPAVDGLKSCDKEISEEVENTKGEGTQQSDHNEESMKQLKKENGAGDKVQLDREGQDNDTNKTTEKNVSNETDANDKTSGKEEEPTKPFKEHCGEGDAHHSDKAKTTEPSITAQDTFDSSKSNELDHALSQETTLIKSPPEENVNDVSNETDAEDKTPETEEEPTKPFKEHCGEGDAHHSDKAETTEPSITAQDTSDSKSPFFYAFAAVMVAILAYWLLRARPAPVQKPFNLMEVFRHEMDKVESSFPSQHKELWRRSRIHLLRHLNMSQPSEPVSLILTSGRGAEKTLGCLAQQLAAAFSTARNASALDIDGTSKTTEDSDQVKLDIDKALREAFDGGKQAVVIHRFEEFPPGSTLIFYRYCDHENAAYKDVFLAFTVLLEEELEPSPNLGMVEEIVQEYLKDKFISSDRTAMFNQMDVDKLSGLWSRISHLILPVSAEERIEQHGCGG